MPKSIYSLTHKKLLEIQSELDIKSNEKMSSEILNKLYRYPDLAFKFNNHISPKVVKYLKDNYDWTLPTVIKQQIAQDKTTKFLVQLENGQSVETVLIPFRKSFTLCVSSQVGCAMNCSFCHTATQGLKGNLKASDIISQYMIAKKNLEDPRPITNIVFMGQGEPLHNFEEVKEAINIFSDPNGISISRQKITVSTSGYVPGIKRFNEFEGVNFALSLHSVQNETRNKLIPINRKYPLAEVQKEINTIKLKPKQFIEYEYLLIKDVNDDEQSALDLASFLKDKKAILNLIPFNEFPDSDYKRPSEESIKKFNKLMVENKIRTMLRGTKGDDILAACGQLKS